MIYIEDGNFNEVLVDVDLFPWYQYENYESNCLHIEKVQYTKMDTPLPAWGHFVIFYKWNKFWLVKDNGTPKLADTNPL